MLHIPEQAPRLVQQWLRVLEYLHRENAIRQIIKPVNIFHDYIEGDGKSTFYFADFGLSVAVKDATSMGRAGTSFFTAPPEVFDESVDAPAQNLTSGPSALR